MAIDYTSNNIPPFYKSSNRFFKEGGDIYKSERAMVTEYKKQLIKIDKQMSDLYSKALKSGSMINGKLDYANAQKNKSLQIMLDSIKSSLKQLNDKNAGIMDSGLKKVIRESYSYSKKLADKSLKIINNAKIDYPKLNTDKVANGMQVNGSRLPEITMQAKNYYPNKTIEQLRQAFLKEGGASLSEVQKLTRDLLNRDAGNIIRTLRTNGTRVVNDTKEIVFKSLTKASQNVKTALGDIPIAENVVKVWNHTSGQTNPREWHIKADGQEADEDGLFTVDGQKVSQPGAFGNPRNDANCLCYITFEIKK